MARLRVAHVGGYVPESTQGVHKTIVGLVDHLPANGIEPELWSLSPAHPEPRWTDTGGIRALELPARPRPWNLLSGLPKASRRAIRERSPHIDIVHFHSVFVPQNVRVARLLDVPYIITPNGGYNPQVVLGRNRAIKWLWLSAFERKYVRSAAALHAVSPPEVADLARFVEPERVIEVPNAIGDEWLSRPPVPPSNRTLLFIGRLAIQHKGLDLLLEGFAQAARSIDAGGWKLILAGPDFRDGKAELSRRARQLGVEERVELRGPVHGEEKRALLNASYAFLHTSRWEGLPFSVLEALAVGRPVLITPGTNMGNLVRENGAGIVAEGDPVSIGRGIEQIIGLSTTAYRAMQERARRMVNEHFTWDRAAASMARHYERIAASEKS